MKYFKSNINKILLYIYVYKTSYNNFVNSISFNVSITINFTASNCINAENIVITVNLCLIMAFSTQMEPGLRSKYEPVKLEQQKFY